ncbi:MAG: hypothetical protein P8L85_22660 [Rubripirellula sp.]|nr:hypothetical protein [Rubripirellula sp.]
MPSESEMKSRPASNSTTDGLRKKQLLVVALVIGLIAALLMQPEEPDLMAPGVTETSAQLRPVSGKPLSSCEMRLLTAPLCMNEHDPAVLCKVRELSSLDLSDMLQLELLAPEPDQPQEVQEASVSQVQAVYGTSKGRTALVGEFIVRGGHALPGGAVVLGVTEEGIHVGRD